MAAGIETILKAADLIADVRRAFGRIEALEQGQRQLADAVAALDVRVREVEAGLREAKAEIRLDAIREAQAIVNSVQGGLHRQITELAVQIDRVGARGATGARLDDRTG